MLKFIHQLLNPHCQHCADERREQREENRYCSSCETLAQENARLVRDNERLMTLVIEAVQAPKIIDTKINDVKDLKPIATSRTNFISSAVRRQMLEKESRHNADLLRNAPKPDVVVIDKDAELQDLEKELDDVRKERESTTKAS